MTHKESPLLIEPEQLQTLLDAPEILIVDLSKASTHNQAHIPGAVFLDYSGIVTAKDPVQGLLPDTQTLEQVMSATGIGNDTRVIAYDDEGGGKATRLLWTLECLGHEQYSLLNGGLHAWINERHPTTTDRSTINPKSFTAHPTDRPVATADYIRNRLNETGTVLLDARTAEEYSGTRRFAQRGGHIPGAVHFDWMSGMDRSRNLRMLDSETLLPLLRNQGITPDREVITYCQTHHRSSYSYIMLKSLGFEQVKGYPGSWSDWGNRNDLPIE